MNKLYLIGIFAALLSIGAINSTNQSISKLEAYNVIISRIDSAAFDSTEIFVSKQILPANTIIEVTSKTIKSPDHDS